MKKNIINFLIAFVLVGTVATASYTVKHWFNNGANGIKTTKEVKITGSTNDNSTDVLNLEDSDNVEVFAVDTDGNTSVVGNLTEGGIDVLNERSTNGSQIAVASVSHGFVNLDAIYHNGSAYVDAKADDVDTLATHIVKKIDDDNFIAVKFGQFTATAHGKTIGQYYYLSNATAGASTNTEPTTGYSAPLYYVVDADTVEAMVLRPSAAELIDPDVNPVMTDWVSWTPTGSWTTNATYEGKWRRVGDTAHIQVRISLGGVPTSTLGLLTINNPSGMVIDTSKLLNSGDKDQLLGMGKYFDFSASAKEAGLLHVGPYASSPTTAIRVQAINPATWEDKLSDVQVTNPIPWDSSDELNVEYKIPIVGWDAAATVNSALNKGKNYIINPDMRISQRGDYTSGTDPAYNAEYYLDRWKTTVNTGTGVTGNISQETTNQPSALAGSKSIKYIATNASTQTGQLGAYQIIEDYSLFAGKTVTVSMWVKSNNSSAGFIIFDTGVTASSNHSGGGGWEKLTATGTVSAGASYLGIYVDIRDNATYGDASIDNGDYIEFTGVKLEFGNKATAFVPPDTASELTKCERYFEVLHGKEVQGQTLIGIRRFGPDNDVDFKWRFKTRKMNSSGTLWSNIPLVYGTTHSAFNLNTWGFITTTGTVTFSTPEVTEEGAIFRISDSGTMSGTVGDTQSLEILSTTTIVGVENEL